MPLSTQLALALVAIVAAAAAVDVPQTPAIETFGNDLQFSVTGDSKVSIKYGDDKTIDLDDASETTVNAIKLGFGIGAQLDSLKKDVSLAETLRGEIKSSVAAYAATNKNDMDNVKQQVSNLGGRQTSDKQELQASINQIKNTLASSAGDIDKVVADAKKKIADAVEEASGSIGGAGVQPIPAWFQMEDSKVSDQGGAVIVFTWPRTAHPLLLVSETKFYRAKFTKLDDSGKKTSDSRWSAWTAVSEDRILQVVMPKWQGKDKRLPNKSEFAVAIEVYEQNRLLPSPKSNTMKVTAQPPSITVPDKHEIFGPTDTRTFFAIDFTLVYPYDDAFDDVEVKATTNNRGQVSDIAITGTPTKAARKLNYAVTSSKEDLTFTFTITTTSKKSKLFMEKTITVIFKGTLFRGMTPGLMDAAQQKSLMNQIGNPKKMELCFSSRSQGWNGALMHNRCDRVNKKTVVIARRGSNMRVFGGYAPEGFNPAYRNRNNYIRSSASGPFLFTVINSKVEYLQKCCRNYRYYFHSNYAYTWGGGHDFYCSNAFTSCYANVHHDYNSNGRGYHTSAAKVYLTGAYSWNFVSEGKNSIYEVFVEP